MVSGSVCDPDKNQSSSPGPCHLLQGTEKDGEEGVDLEEPTWLAHPICTLWQDLVTQPQLEPSRTGECRLTVVPKKEGDTDTGSPRERPPLPERPQ